MPNAVVLLVISISVMEVSIPGNVLQLISWAKAGGGEPVAWTTRCLLGNADLLVCAGICSWVQLAPCANTDILGAYLRQWSLIL